MARKQNENVENVDNVELTPQEEEIIEDIQDDQKEDDREDDTELSQELQELYGHPEPDEQHSAHTILNKAMFIEPDTHKTTFLNESELGRPLFSVRFLLDLHKSALHHKLPRLQAYYWNKIQNVTNTGLSNKGFGLNIAVTQKRDTTRRRVRDNPIDQKGGTIQ